MNAFDFLISPFLDFDFMARALMAAAAVSVIGAPIGVFLMFRRLALVGDALSHALLPGAAIGYLFAGLYFPALFLGGLVAGLLVAVLASWIAEVTAQREDNSLAALYLISLAAGVLIVSRTGNSVDLLHLLFGSVLSLDNITFAMVLGGSAVALILMLGFGRALLFEALDPEHLNRLGFPVRRIHFLFLFLVVLTLVTGFQALGTLMALGIILIPATSARLMTDSLPRQIFIAMGIGLGASYLGLLLSFHANWPSGPAIVVSCGLFYLLAFLFGPSHGVWRKIFPLKHQKVALSVLIVSGAWGLQDSTAHATKATPLKFAEATPLKVAETAPLKIVTSFSISQDWAQQLAGPTAQVQSLIKAGQDPHGFQPRVSEIKSLKEADLFVTNGWGLDPWAQKLRQASGTQAKLIELSSAVTPLETESDPEHNSHGHHHHGSEDPHFWQDPYRGLQALARLRDELILLRPLEKAQIEARFQDLKNQIEKIQNETKTELAKLPSPKRALSPHASFRYLGEAYGIEFASPQGLSTDQDLSASRLAEIEKFLRDGKVQAAFFEVGRPAPILKNLLQKNPLPSAELYSDSLGLHAGEAQSYTELLRANSQALLRTFGQLQNSKAKGR